MVYAGLKAFVSRIRDVIFLSRFRVASINKYTCKTRPDVWLVDYHTVYRTSGGNDYVEIHYLPLFLADSARACITKRASG